MDRVLAEMILNGFIAVIIVIGSAIIGSALGPSGFVAGLIVGLVVAALVCGLIAIFTEMHAELIRIRIALEQRPSPTQHVYRGYIYSTAPDGKFLLELKVGWREFETVEDLKAYVDAITQ
jgi:hypothetical protein